MALSKIDTANMIDNVNLATGPITGTLATGNGGTGATSFTAGSLVKIAEADYSSGVSSVTMTDCFTSTYSVYKYYLYNLFMASNNSELRVYYKDSSANNIGNFQVTGSQNYIAIDSNTAGHGNESSSGENYIRVDHNDLDSISDQGSALELTIYQPYESIHTITSIDYHLRSDNNYIYHKSGTAFLRSTTSCRSLTISNDQGINFAGYKSVIYGVKR